MMTNAQVHSDLAIPPGEYLGEVLAELGMTKTELAKRMGRPAPKLSAIFSGEKAITSETALQLETVLGIPAHIWVGLEAEYRLTLARQQAELESRRLKQESGVIGEYRYAELAKLGYVEKKTKPADKVRELRQYFGVTSLTSVADLNRYRAVFRQGAGAYSAEATSSWLRIGEARAQRTACPAFKPEKLRSALAEIRGMSLLHPEEFGEKLRRTLHDSGVVFVLCPHLPKTYAHGATFWLGGNKPVLMLTIRRSWADIFWFSLFHEIGHILLHGRSDIFLEGPDQGKQKEFREQEADRFAGDILIPSTDYSFFVRTKKFSANAIKEFASRIEVHPGIVVGRLQHDDHILPSWHNALRGRYTWGKQG